MFKKYLKKSDIVLFAALLAFGLACMFFTWSKNAGTTVLVSVNGKTVKELNLQQDGEYLIETDWGSNTITIKNGEVWCSESDCPNGDCKNFGKISKEGQVILCIPHRLSVQISGKEAEVDGVSY